MDILGGHIALGQDEYLFPGILVLRHIQYYGGMAGQPVELSVVEEPAEACLGDYERLLGDAMSGDATLFARQDVVEAAWAIVDPLLADPGPMFEYEPGSWGPPQADRLVAEIGGWNTPQ